MRKRAPARAAQRARGRTPGAPTAGEHQHTRHLYKVTAAGRQVAQVERLERTGVLLDDERRYIHGDHLGSSQVITDEDGELVHVQRFDPFGAPIDPEVDPTAKSGDAATKNIRRGFTGHETDVETGLVNMGGRIYDPRVGRFMQADPILQPGWSQTLNRYSYVANNPLNAVDPSGFMSDLSDFNVQEDNDEDPDDRTPDEGGTAPANPANTNDTGAETSTIMMESVGFSVESALYTSRPRGTAPAVDSGGSPKDRLDPSPNAGGPAFEGPYHGGYSGNQGPENNGPPNSATVPSAGGEGPVQHGGGSAGRDGGGVGPETNSRAARGSEATGGESAQSTSHQGTQPPGKIAGGKGKGVGKVVQLGIQAIKDGFKTKPGKFVKTGAKATFEDLVEAVKAGEDVIVDSASIAKQIAVKVGGGKAPTLHNVKSTQLEQGFLPHFHPAGSKAHVFFEPQGGFGVIDVLDFFGPLIIIPFEDLLHPSMRPPAMTAPAP
jgi:RHS repeat-associated protein